MGSYQTAFVENLHQQLTARQLAGRIIGITDNNQICIGRNRIDNIIIVNSKITRLLQIIIAYFAVYRAQSLFIIGKGRCQ